MRGYKCASCGKVFDPEKDEICPACGDAVSPSVLTRMERKQTAERLRAEGARSYDPHCHEDEAWYGSEAAGTHRAAVREHEAKLRAGYAAHKPVDNPTRVSNANPAAQSADQNRTRKSSGSSAQKKPPQFLLLLVFLLPALIAVLRVLGSALLEWFERIFGGIEFPFP